MIETNYYILTNDQYEECYSEASRFDVSIDYFLMEFCDIKGEEVLCEWKGGHDQTVPIV